MQKTQIQQKKQFLERDLKRIFSGTLPNCPPRQGRITSPHSGCGLAAPSLPSLPPPGIHREAEARMARARRLAEW